MWLCFVSLAVVFVCVFLVSLKLVVFFATAIYVRSTVLFMVLAFGSG